MRFSFLPLLTVLASLAGCGSSTGLEQIETQVLNSQSSSNKACPSEKGDGTQIANSKSTGGLRDALTCQGRVINKKVAMGHMCE